MRTKDNYNLPAGTVLNDKWVILEFIAKGGMGEIYRAHQLNLNRDVAIKTISKEWLEDIEEDEEEVENAFRRFRQEVLTMAQIRHPNIIQIYDFDTATVRIGNDNIALEYIALEYVPGRTLKDTIPEEGFYPEEEKIYIWLQKIFIPMLNGLKAIHDAGILHRDIKPANILMDGDIPKIADFGLARSCRMESMTCSLEIKGSPAYMAPEQFIDFKGTDERTDIYSLGKILYEAIDGKIPPNAIPFRQVHLKKTDTSFFQHLDNILGKATEEKPKNRHQSVAEIKEVVERFLHKHEYVLAHTSEKRTSGIKHLQLSRRNLILLACSGLLLAILLVSWGYHSFREHFSSQIYGSSTKLANGSPAVNYPPDLPRKISVRDGSILMLIPGGKLQMTDPKSGEVQNINVRTFYMDKTPVTNQQFVDFLNSVGKTLVHDDKSVKQDNRTLLYLGEVVQGYEPLIFSNGMFRVKHSGHSACPVVRVTAYGALAYAKFYGRRLPTEAEWIYTATRGTGSSLSQISPTLTAPLEMPVPVMMLPANSLGVKGMNLNLGCWITKNDGTSQDDSLLIIGGFSRSHISNNAFPTSIKREPWEAFEEVGFRCATDVSNQI